MNISWNADNYTRNFSFVHEYGNSVLDLADFSVIRTAIDLGCGNGALTAKIMGKGVSVIGIDASPDMLETARRNYPDIAFILADAVDFSIPEPVDLVFSNAVFHWIDREKQKAMLTCVSRALKENGQFVFEFGGYGNCALIHAAVEEAFRESGFDYPMPFYFPKIGEYAPLVESCGMTVTSALLFERPTELRGENGLLDWIDMFLKYAFERIGGESKEKIRQRAADLLKPRLYIDGKWYADYVRIRMKAVKR